MEWQDHTADGEQVDRLSGFTLADALGEPRMDRSVYSAAAQDKRTAAPGRPDVCSGAGQRSQEAVSSGALKAQLTDDLRREGFDSLVYAAFETAGHRRLRAFVLRDFVPPGYLESYFAGGLDDGDPRLAAVDRSGLPCIWDAERLLRDSRATPSVQKLTFLLRRHDMGSGVTFGIAVPDSDLHVVIDLATRAVNADWIVDRVVSQALMTGLTVHRAVRQHVERAVCDARHVALGSEQSDVLSNLVLGLSAREIAQRLDLTVHQVNYHIRSLQKKFHVVNRMQLAYVAGRRERGEQSG
jgi:DNA-binding CsgD family transcriptional regulator